MFFLLKSWGNRIVEQIISRESAETDIFRLFIVGTCYNLFTRMYAGGDYMIKTTKKLINEGQITNILKDIVLKSYQQIKDEDILLCLECSDVDLEIATYDHLEFEAAIKANFELDQFGEILDHDEYRQLMYELYDYFIDLHKESGFFDFFPEGEYIVNGEKRVSDSDMIAPTGRFLAPFEDALLNESE